MTIELKIPLIGGPAHGRASAKCFDEQVDESALKKEITVAEIKGADYSIIVDHPREGEFAEELVEIHTYRLKKLAENIFIYEHQEKEITPAEVAGATV